MVLARHVRANPVGSHWYAFAVVGALKLHSKATGLQW